MIVCRSVVMNMRGDYCGKWVKSCEMSQILKWKVLPVGIMGIGSHIITCMA